MTRLGIYSFAGFLLAASGSTLCGAEVKGGTPDFQEVYQLIKAHVPGLSEAELNRAAVQGLLSELHPKVMLVANGKSSVVEGPVLSKTNVFEDNIAYLRIAHVADGLAKEVSNVFARLGASNKLDGLILDLRYADGMDYTAATATADLFLSKKQLLLNWGNGPVSSQDKTNAIQLPLAILVNGGTSGSAEALAAALRAGGVGLILGSRTAGEALVAQDIPLKTGEKLRIASAPITLGNGSVISTNGVKPDIDVTVNPEDEHSYYADAFFVVRKTNQMSGESSAAATNQVAGTNGTRRARFGEAELVREHRAGLDRDNGETPRAREPEPEKPMVSDPTLARAIDLLKGLAVVRQTRS